MRSALRQQIGRLRSLLLGGAPGVSRRDVVAAFEIVLGRPPESEAAIRRYLHFPDRATLGRDPMGTDEFQARLEGRPLITRQGPARP